MSSSKIPCTYEKQVYIIMYPLYWVMAICLVLLWPVHAINLCCTIVGPSYTMLAQHKGNIGSASFTCVVVDLHFCKTKIPTECPDNNHSLFNQHLRLWINMNPVLGHRSYWCAASISAAHWPNICLALVHRCDAGPKLWKHWAGVDLSCLRCRIDNDVRPSSTPNIRL